HETVQAMLRAAQALERAADVHPDDALAAESRRLAHALRSLAKAEPAQRARAAAALIPGLVTTFRQLRAALRAEPVALRDLPDDLIRDWVVPDGRARIEVFPKGDAN